MKLGRKLKYLLAAALLGGLLYASVTQAIAGSDEFDRANVGFGTTISDAQVLKLMELYEVAPQAVYMWTSGLTGTNRPDEPKTAETFLKDTRAKSIESFEKGLEGNVIRLQRFVETHTENEVAASEALQEEARSLLNIRSKLEAALKAARNGDSLVFAIEIAGSKNQLERLRTDGLVKAFELSTVVDGKVIVPHTPKPEAYQQDWADPEVQAMSGRELYQRIKLLANSN